MLNQSDNHVRKALCHFLLWGLLGLLVACGLPMMQVVAQPPLAATANLDQAQALSLQAQQLLEQGHPQAALEQWEQAEQLFRQIGDETGIIGTQLNQAKALQRLGFYRRAKTLLETVVASQQQQPNSPLKANGLLTLGTVLRLMGEYEPAQKVLTESLHIAQQLNSTPDIQAAYLHLGNTQLAQQRSSAALDSFSQAAALEGPLQLAARLHQLKLLQQLNHPTEAASLRLNIEAQLATLPLSQQLIYGQIELASLLSAMPDNSQQPLSPLKSETLQAAKLLTTAAQQAKSLGDRHAASYAIGRLGHLYEQTQQWAEAKQLTQQAEQLAKGSNVPEILYQWQWQRGRILRSQGDIVGATAAYTQAVDTLQLLRSDLISIAQDVQFSFRDQVEPVYRELVDLLLQSPNAAIAGENRAIVSQTNLKKARQVIESLQLAELTNFFREACLDVQIRPIDEIDQTAATIYPILLRDRLEVILSLPGQPLQHYATRQPQTAIEAGIEQMQASLRPTSFAQEREAVAQQLYRWLIQPAEPTLRKHQIKTLVFVLDGSLRNVPMAALYDGHHYLVEHYQIAIAPSLQLSSPRNLQPAQIRALVAGLSESVAGLAPLPGVQREVETISHQISAHVLLNRSFTTSALKAKVQTAPFNIVHLATHGKFSSKPQDTYIQAWDGRLTVNDLQAVLNQRSLTNTDVIELLVLSACETAAGDNRAALGMAGVAVRSGARSTLASLWTVNDVSTAAFITAFYKALTQPNTSKAQAVQQAQISLIQSPKFKHPFYWSPFILVGNWL